MPIISVIVPIYKAERTIRKCLNSIITQTFKDFELLLIDDGSPDESGAICDEYALTDNRIRVFHKKNEGVSAARQTGIENAKGKYTIHVDPDDWIDADEFEILYIEAMKSNADMVICDFYEERHNGKTIYRKQRPTSTKHLSVLKDVFGKIHGSCCNKLISLDCYKRFNIRFPSGINYCEDQYVVASILLHDIKISYVPKAFYHYVQYDDKMSLAHMYDERTYECDLKRIELFSELLKEHEDIKRIMLNRNYKNMVRRAFYFSHQCYSSSSFKERFSQYSYLIKRSNNTKDKIFILPACYGLFSVSKNIYEVLKKICI